MESLRNNFFGGNVAERYSDGSMPTTILCKNSFELNVSKWKFKRITFLFEICLALKNLFYFYRYNQTIFSYDKRILVFQLNLPCSINHC